MAMLTIVAGVGDLAHKDGPAGQHQELQPSAVAGLLTPGQHIVVVEVEGHQVLAVHRYHWAACIYVAM